MTDQVLMTDTDESHQFPARLRSSVTVSRTAIVWLTMLTVAVVLATWAVTQTTLPSCPVGTQDDLGCARGFQTRETTGLRSFRWTDEQATLWFSGLGFGSPRAIEIVMAAQRPPGAVLPLVTLTADTLTTQVQLPTTIRHYRLLVPPAAIGADILALTITSETWEPIGDQRSLGVAVYEARALPVSGVRLPGLMPLLALLALALSTILLCSPYNAAHSTILRGWPIGAALGVLGLAAGLWALLPARVSPFLPGLALIVGSATLLRRRAQAPGRLSQRVVAIVIGVNAALDAALISSVINGALVAPALLAQAVVSISTIWWFSRRQTGEETGQEQLTLRYLLGVTLAVRLLAFAARILTGIGASDPDTELFYNYGRAVIEVGVPTAEYPSGALLFWALLALPASRELFALLLPLVNLLCELGVVAAIWGVENREQMPNEQGNKGTREQEGKEQRTTQRVPDKEQKDLRGLRALRVLRGKWSSSHLALFYVLSPLLLVFWHAKYDPLPAALLALGLAAYAQKRFGWSGAMLGLGGAIKWVPWLAVPFLGWQLFRSLVWPGQAAGTRRQSLSEVVRFSGGCVLAVVAASLPFALRDWQGFLAPYIVQGARPLIGESIWFLPAFPLEPELLSKLTAPWSGVESDVIPTSVMVGAQLVVLLAIALALILLPPNDRRTLTLAALAPAVFLLLNRVFSPQYLVIITICGLLAGAVTLRGREVFGLMVLLVLTQASNLLIWPYTQHYWLAASAFMFILTGGIIIWILYKALGVSHLRA